MPLTIPRKQFRTLAALATKLLEQFDDQWWFRNHCASFCTCSCPSRFTIHHIQYMLMSQLFHHSPHSAWPSGCIGESSQDREEDGVLELTCNSCPCLTSATWIEKRSNEQWLCVDQELCHALWCLSQSGPVHLARMG